MEKSLAELDRLQSLINSEYSKYKHTIKQDRELAEVKNIYIHIKELEKKISEMSNRIHKILEKKRELYRSWDKSNNLFFHSLKLFFTKIPALL